jgi:hypothetical protein
VAFCGVICCFDFQGWLAMDRTPTLNFYVQLKNLTFERMPFLMYQHVIVPSKPRNQMSQTFLNNGKLTLLLSEVVPGHSKSLIQMSQRFWNNGKLTFVIVRGCSGTLGISAIYFLEGIQGLYADHSIKWRDYRAMYAVKWLQGLHLAEQSTKLPCNFRRPALKVSCNS